MKIPIRASFIGLILLVEAYLLIKGEQCWMPMICDDQPTWRDVNTERQCTKEQENALEALTEQVHETESMLDQLQKRLEDLSTNSVQPSVVDVKETTTPQGYKDKKTTAPATSPWSTKEAFFSTFRPQTTKVEQSTVRTCPAPKAPDNGTVNIATAFEVNQTIEYSCNAGYVLQGSNIGICRENGTWGEVPTCIVDLTCDFESSTNPTCGYTRVNGTFQREYRDNGVTGYVLAGNGTIRSLPKALAGNEELCMSVDIKDTSDGELVAKAHNGTVTKAIWPFSASTTWKTEKFILKKVNSTDTEVQLELEASGNVELDNITTLNSSECYGLDTPCVKQNLENGTISPEQDLYSQDQEVSYSCNSNYTLEGGQTGTCKADGSWSITPVCTKCGVVYNSRCFRAIVYDVRNVTLSVAESICENKLANIYDVTHYNLLRDYLRPMIPDGWPYIRVYTGMNYTNGQLYSTTGQAMSLPKEVWYPIPYASSTSVVVLVARNPEEIYRGIFNVPPSSEYNGAICENEL
ncbi:uncharacterized protein LOC120346972 isoform X1 [Styela clava]